MTRQTRSLDILPSPGKRTLLRPLRPQRNLTDEVIERITREISSGRLQPGARLPTEQELMAAMGVSRTVVREAVSALRADGLVTTRQGSGAYVASDVSRMPFRINPDGLSSIEDVLAVMELRLAIEIEAAALAAERITPRGLVPLARALRAIETAIGKDEGAVTEDFAFHLAIAEASGNPHFAQFLDFLGRHVIPRQSVRVALSTAREQRHYLTRIQVEHRRIHEAIAKRDPNQARRAMREHLTRSLKRYRGIAERQQGGS
jgi:GntR family transcriptional regulator, transcriptional repressor for pyruvate dehydrogenase complex